MKEQKKLKSFNENTVIVQKCKKVKMTKQNNINCDKTESIDNEVTYSKVQ